jgi:hypothetical protein
VTPDEHLTQAAAYIARAEQSVWRHPGRSSDKLPFIGEDPSLERHVNVYTRLATAHMQMASTKSLVEATSKPRHLSNESRYPLMKKLEGTDTNK